MGRKQGDGLAEAPDEHLPAYEIKPALCLDLDGTVRYSKNGEFINSPEDVVVFPDVEAKLWEYCDAGYVIAGVTNQGGVAFGYKTVKGHMAEINAMLDQFERDPFDIILAAFSHPEGKVEPYNRVSMMRKPQIGMLAQCEHHLERAGIVVDWENSLMVGDRPEDQELAERAGIAFRWADDFFGRG